MEKIQEQLPFIRVLSDSNRVEFQQLVLYSSKLRIEVICEFLVNILNGNIESSEQNMKDLMKHKRVLHKLIRPELTIKQRKTIIRRHAMLVQETITYFLPRLEKLLIESANPSDTDSNSGESDQDNESSDTSISASEIDEMKADEDEN